tara:strand:- start:1736 stop:2632 length:897 start_codon:yes stop_codon:yes gene_type:complete
MSYKYIRTFGTSYTEGGGFHYWVNKRIKILYNKLRPMVDNSMFEFSWPSFLQKKVTPKVINHARSGHGNDRIFREVYKVVESDEFNPSENLFLFELSALGRDEFYSKEIGEWGVLNYKMDWNNHSPTREGFGMGFNYFNQIHLGSDWIDKHLPMFETLVMETIDADVHLQTMIRKLKMFFCYCDAANLNWYIVADETMFVARPELRKWIHRFLGDKDYKGIFESAGETITDETGGHFADGHFGMHANQTIGLYVAKRLNEYGEVGKLLEYDVLDKDDIKKTILENSKNLKVKYEKDLI